jgi:hypothetical protein
MKLFSAPQSYTPLQRHTCPSPRPTVQARSGHLFKNLVPVASSKFSSCLASPCYSQANLKNLTEEQLTGYLERLTNMFSNSDEMTSCIWEDELKWLIDLCKNSPEHHLNLAGNKLFYRKQIQGKKTEYTLLFEKKHRNPNKDFIVVHQAFFRLIEDRLGVTYAVFRAVRNLFRNPNPSTSADLRTALKEYF